MFYCELCQLDNDWPGSYFRSYGTCEVCGVVTSCNDTPSAALPPARWELFDTKTGEKIKDIEIDPKQSARIAFFVRNPSSGVVHPRPKKKDHETD